MNTSRTANKPGSLNIVAPAVSGRFSPCSRRPRHRGMALMLVLFVVFIISVLGYAASAIATLDSRSATQEYLSARAMGLARAGLSRACAELASNFAFASTSAVSYDLKGGSYTVSVFPSPNNTGNVYKLWRVTSTGFPTPDHGVQRTLVSWVEMQSFAKYAYFTNAEFAAGSNTPIKFTSADRLTGDVHTNGYFTMLTTPRFSRNVTSANQGDTLYNATARTYNQSGTQTDASRFYRYSSSYNADYPTAYNNSPNFAFSGGQPVITPPSSMTNVQNAATGAGTSYSGNATVIFNSNGTATVQRAGYSNVTVSLNTPQTIYVTGTATVYGTVKGRCTVGAGTAIKIPSNLTYSDTQSDVLGLVSPGNITVTKTTNGDFTIQAAIMSLSNSFTVSGYNSGSYRGNLNILGGIIQYNRGPVGTSNGSGGIQTGYAKNYVYDDKLANSPPPNFPTTGKVTLRSFIDQGALH